MANGSSVLEPPAEMQRPRFRPLKTFRPSARVIWTDRIAAAVISSSGLFVIAAVVLILIFIGKEALPLFYPPTAVKEADLKLPPGTAADDYLTWSTDEFGTFSYGICRDGTVRFISNADGAVAHELPVAELRESAPELAWVSPLGDRIAAIRRDGKLKLLSVAFGVSYDENKNQVLTPSLTEFAIQEFPVGFRPKMLAADYNSTTDSLAIAVLGEDNRLFAGKFLYMGEMLEMSEMHFIPEGKVTAIAIDWDARFVLATTDANALYRWNLWREGDDKLVEKLKPSRTGSFPTAVQPLLGSFTFILGYADGSVEAWFGVRRDRADTEFGFQRIRDFEAHKSRVTGIIASGVDRSFWTYDADGEARMHFNPSARKLYAFRLPAPIRGLAMNSHLNDLSVLRQDGVLDRWSLHNPHPDVTLKTLFGGIWYEGYSEPQFIWQSSSGSDNFEAKFSLTPLTIGTLKGAFYGLIFAIPVAVLAALYVSQLMQPRLRTPIKATMEIMAALPSVVIGFLAGLWMAPFLEKHLVALLMVLPVLMMLIAAAAYAYFRIPRVKRARIPPATELVILIGLVLAALVVSNWIAGPIEQLLFHGNVQQWIYETTGEKVEQRNSLVIGLAMGFAVIPIIFSISEDALSNVPRHYVSGSLALGATQWQSAVRVVLPTASPGIFSAVMLGFGRAVGETMIVLMATGNTPIMSFSPFNGMRTLAANIAVEIPEAPHSGSLYRILFLAAALLFILTFVVNTAAELVRQRLRGKYRAI